MIVPGDIARFDFGLVHPDGTRPFFMVAMLANEEFESEETEDGTRTFYAVTFIQTLGCGRFKLVQCTCFCDYDEMHRVVSGTATRSEDGAA